MKALRCTVWVLAFALAPLTAAAQSTGAIAGIVRDTSGGVLPGVTVEASSPALIEGVRAGVTDGSGNYQVVALRPGTYTVTFTLPGFSTVVHEGIELTTGFTASVNADMPVGGVEETITVTGASPVVDIQNSLDQAVLDSDMLWSVPTAHKNAYSFGALTIGVTMGSSTGQDVGGSQHEVGGALSYHGVNGADSKMKIDGMEYNSLHGTAGGSQRLFHPNQLAMEEVNLGLGSAGAEHSTAGVSVNMIPKEGGNQFTFTGTATFANESFESDNLSDAIKARGLNETSHVEKTWDNGVAVGGPISRDRAWFFVSPRFWGNHNRLPDAFFNSTQGTPFYTADLSKPAVANLWDRNLAMRVTWQVNDKHKVNVGHSEERSCFCTFVASAFLTPESFVSYHFNTAITQGAWTFPATNRLLFQAGVAYNSMGLSTRPQENVGPNDIAIVDGVLGKAYNSVFLINLAQGLPYGEGTRNDPLHGRFSVSYVSGSHSFKVGLQIMEGWEKTNGRINKDLSYLFLNQVPSNLTQYATPLTSDSRVRSTALYAQDQWTIDRLTLNLGARFDYFKGWVKAQTVPAGSWVPERPFGRVDDVPNYKDVTPRVGAAYDLFGDGKTAIKASFGIYVGSEGAGLTLLNDPLLLSVTQTSRTWADANTDFVPDCDLTNFAANGECGAISNNLFGTTVAGISYADDAIRGWGNRTRNSQMSVSLQQELRPGWSAVIGYYRTAYGSFLSQVNTSLTAGDFDTFCVTAPMDSRLPGGGGNEICGVVDVKPASFGQVTTAVQPIDSLGVGDATRVFNGMDFAVHGRFGRGGTLTSGIFLGRTRRNDCALNSLPQVAATGAAWNGGGSSTAHLNSFVAHPLTAAYCDTAPPWSKTVHVKVNGLYPLPYGFEVSGVFQNLPGAVQLANRRYTSAEVASTLGRPLVLGSVNVPLVPADTLFEKRLTQLDVRLTKVFQFGEWRLKGNLDVYNALNESAVTQLNTTFGANWLGAQRLMFGRMVKIGGQIDF